jgi:hypothetical protein
MFGVLLPERLLQVDRCMIFLTLLNKLKISGCMHLMQRLKVRPVRKETGPKIHGNKDLGASKS